MAHPAAVRAGEPEGRIGTQAPNAAEVSPRMNVRRDYYQVLGVPRDADAGVLKKAFRELASRYHPDTSTEPDAEQQFRWHLRTQRCRARWPV